MASTAMTRRQLRAGETDMEHRRMGPAGDRIAVLAAAIPVEPLPDAPAPVESIS
jgi:hypothetical protein